VRRVKHGVTPQRQPYFVYRAARSGRLSLETCG